MSVAVGDVSPTCCRGEGRLSGVQCQHTASDDGGCAGGGIRVRRVVGSAVQREARSRGDIGVGRNLVAIAQKNAGTDVEAVVERIVVDRDPRRVQVQAAGGSNAIAGEVFVV